MTLTRDHTNKYRYVFAVFFYSYSIFEVTVEGFSILNSSVIPYYYKLKLFTHLTWHYIYSMSQYGECI